MAVMTDSYREQVGLDRPVSNENRVQTRADDALSMLNKRVESMGEIIGILEARLGAVMNDHAQPSSDEAMKDPGKPSGDSALLMILYGFGADLIRYQEQLQTIISRLDV